MQDRQPPFLTARQVWTITILGALLHIAMAGARVAVSLSALSLGASELVVGMLIACFSLVPALASLQTGRILDRIAPVSPLIAAGAAHVVGILVPFIFAGLWPLYTASLLVGTSSSLFYLAQHRIIGTRSAPSDRTRNLSIAAVGFAVSGLIGPLVAGVGIDHFGHAIAFLLLGLPAVIATIALQRGALQLAPQAADTVSSAPASVRRQAFDLLRLPGMARIYARSILFAAAWDAFTLFVPIRGSRIGLSATVIGAILAALTAGLITIRVLLPLLVRHVSPGKFMLSGHVLVGTGFLLFSFTQSVPLLMACAFVVGLAIGVSQPVSMSLMFEACPAERAGEAVGLRVMLLGCSQSGLPLLLGGLSTLVGVAPILWIVSLFQFAASRVPVFSGNGNRPR